MEWKLEWSHSDQSDFVVVFEGLVSLYFCRLARGCLSRLTMSDGPLPPCLVWLWLVFNGLAAGSACGRFGLVLLWATSGFGMGLGSLEGAEMKTLTHLLKRFVSLSCVRRCGNVLYT